MLRKKKDIKKCYIKKLLEQVSLQVDLDAKCQRYQGLLNLASEAFLVINYTSVIHSANQAASLLLNMPNSLLIGEYLADFLSVVDYRHFIDKIKQLDRISFQEFSAQICPINKSPIPVDIRVSAFTEPEGNLVYLVVLRDISERQQLEQALRESAECYDSIVEFSGLAIAVHSEDKFVYINPAGVELFGAANSEELINKPIWDIIHPDSRENVCERIYKNEILEELTPYREQKLIRLDGLVKYVEVTGRRLYYQGKLSTQVLIRDITKRKQTEEEIRQALLKEKKFSELKSHFITRTSHEFRTPLSIILNSSEILKYYSDKLTENKKQEHLDKIRAEVNQLVQLLDDIQAYNSDVNLEQNTLSLLCPTLRQSN